VKGLGLVRPVPPRRLADKPDFLIDLADTQEAAYNKAQRLPERRKMMQTWADYLDGLREGANVVQIRRAS